MAKITDEEFDKILNEILHEKRGDTLLSIPGIYEILSEEYNNDVLEIFAERYNESYECPLMTNGIGSCGHYHPGEPECPLMASGEEDYYCENLTEEELEIIKQYMEENNL